MREFIETHGAKEFYVNYEDYVRMIDMYDQETVDAFLEDFDIDDIQHLEDVLWDTMEAKKNLRRISYLNGLYCK